MIYQHLDAYFLSRPVAKTTKLHYEITARMFDGWYSSSGCEGVTTDTLNRFLAWYETQVSANTVRSKRAVLLAICNFAEIEINRPRVRLVRKQPKVIDSWTIEQCRTMTYAASQLPGTLKGIDTSRGDYGAVLIALAIETGMRRGDLLRIESANVVKGKWQQVQGKTGHLVSCEISDGTKQRAMALPCFGGQYCLPSWTNDHKTAVSTIAKRAMQRAWLESPDGCLKKLRRSSITIAEKGQAGTGYLQGGHSTPTVTHQSYIDVSQLERSRPAAFS